ncbi:unnamed protein product [Spirodela intermedia]|uniref:AN1-type domain-containing protein n=1 Tax=Spirodela intermedia TaxID=51605 RepID=A0A7I8JDS4_SPIIN|nr:unnamed protein product [Spirodela intermedia]CAA6668300.1 unnamed protein product [Spirodela intermedia]
MGQYNRRDPETLIPSPYFSPSSAARCCSPPSLFLKPCLPAPARRGASAADPGGAATSNPSKPSQEDQEAPSSTRRCSCCRRRVGLTGFRCRCGDLFCSRHRYSDVHDCSFDYKAAGREEISKANP